MPATAAGPAPDSNVKVSLASSLLAGWVTTAVLAGTWWATDWHYRIGIAVPWRRIAVPVLWWFVCVVYFWVTRALTSATLARAPAIVDMLLLHILWALVSFYMVGEYAALVGPAYAWYIAGAVFTSTGLIAYRAGAAAFAVLDDTTAGLRVPLATGTAVAACALLMAGHWLLSITILSAAVLGYEAGRGTTRLGALATWPSRVLLPTLLVRDKWTLGAIILVAVSLRMAWYQHLVAQVGFDYRTGFLAASDDGQSYHSIAVKLASDLSLLLGTSNPVAEPHFDPLYSVLLGLWYRVVGVRYTPTVLVQCLLAVFPVVVTYLVARRLAGDKAVAGLLAATLVAISQPLIGFSAIYGVEALYIPVLAAWVWAAWRYSAGAGWRTIVGLGIMGGLILGLRRFGPLFLVALLPWMLWAGRGRSMRARWLGWGAACGIAILMYLPVELMYLRNGTGRLSTLKTPAMELVWTQGSPFPDAVPDNARLIQAGLNPAEPVASLRAIVLHPLQAATAVWAVVPPRVLAFFFWPAFGQFDSITLVNPRFPNRLTPILEFYLTLAALVGIGLGLVRKDTRDLAMLLLMVIGIQTFASSIIAITNTVRYSAPIRPLLMAFAASGLVLTLERLRSGGLRVDRDRADRVTA